MSNSNLKTKLKDIMEKIEKLQDEVNKIHNQINNTHEVSNNKKTKTAKPKTAKTKKAKSGNVSSWIQHVKDYASKNNMKYPEALKDPNCKKEYKN